MLQIGLNPYGLTYTVGLQAAGTSRANPNAIGLYGFIALAHELGASCIELDSRWLLPLSDEELGRVRLAVLARPVTPICSHGLSQQPGETLAPAIRCTRGIGATLLRMHATPVLEGARARWGARWPAMLDHARALVTREAPRAAALGVVLAVENHQDLGSDELVALAEAGGENVGIVLDTGNAFAVGEDPVDFARRVAPYVRHVHLKDYRAQFTDEGFRLVRCAIGDGAVPLAEMRAALAPHRPSLTASIEPAALEARHIRLFMPDWWQGYAPRRRGELDRAIARLRATAVPPEDDYRTPWELEAPAAELIAYERAHVERSIENLRGLGWL